MAPSTKSKPSRPSKAQRATVPAWAFYAMFALLFGANALTATALVFAPEIGKIFSRHNDLVVSAYEDRLSQMRVEIDRLHSRVYAQAGDINIQLQEVAQQQELLLEQQQLVRVLVDRAGQLGIAALPSPSLPDIGDTTDIAATSEAVQLMFDETQNVMTSIISSARNRTTIITSELNSLGISPATAFDADAIGGPFFPAMGEVESLDTLAAANQVMSALTRYKAARTQLDLAPVHMPISGNFRQSSGFGNRTDPFTRGRAFHSGLDFAAPTGSTVLAAGDGLVSFVGAKPGYGNTVEITHTNGLITRYAHLSRHLAHEGQTVRIGTPIALVGSTGRSTGPHLHFEVRQSDTALDPRKFLDVGKRLRAQLG